jgi:hypothetical protein
MVDLQEIATVWETPTLDERERQAFPAEWDNALDRLAIIAAMMRDGALNDGEIAGLRDVARDLRALQPVMERLHLAVPDPVLLASVLDSRAA